ncbi:MAG: PD40 domain-containing protein [Pirellulales bacterium]|nr:PD40 domain-containing protein [Pirellulales bacterium]
MRYPRIVLNYITARRISLSFGSAVFLLVAALLSGSRAEEQPCEIWTIRPDGSGLKRLLGTTGYTCGSPEWSPDGQWVAYDTWRVGQTLHDAQIVVVRANGTDARTLGLGAMPSWSPDGNLLVFHTYGINQNELGQTDTDHIVVMNADGTGREVILDHWGSPRWSPRGDRIVSLLNGNIALYDLATGKEHVVLPHAYSIHWGLGVSRDGRHIAFCGSDSGMYLAALDELKMQATVRTIVAEGRCDYPSFSPDGQRLVFAYRATEKSPLRLHLIDLSPGAKPSLIPGQEPLQGGWGPHWSSDGETIVFTGPAKKDADPPPANPHSGR